ncbi:hypothetical protein GCM10010909_28570 [Acidocella aquatica]|uniref:OmpA-like domain-containing protein n=2 Tax=Acidocella aquatica TaxID=1922313 RepID=A0ABQ6ABK9_9PROT|nr:hypothetical protein GCM10010909_28570 [Acidocella aquatica]
MEGGAIAQNRQPPPGADQPYPNLADVPPAPAPTPPGEQAAIANRARASTPGVSPPSPGALAGLELPAAPPPLPKIPGLRLTQSPAATPLAAPAPAAPPPNGPPVALAFAPGSAILPAADLAPIGAIAAERVKAIAAERGNANILAGGFGESFALALARAQRLGEALTAAGVPASAIKLVAQPSGSGGFVQLVY